jgi:hypothetical protein
MSGDTLHHEMRWNVELFCWISVAAAVSRGYLRADAWKAFTSPCPYRPSSGYLAQMYRKEPHVPPVTSIRILAETTGV